MKLDIAKINPRPVIIWLLLCCLLVLAMVALGGYTRLSNSGLSMVDWRPVTGILPPMSEEAWQQAFAQYQTSPEYQKINKGFGLEGFKRIFWAEYFHRLLGRAVGIVFLVPFLWFAVTGNMTRSLAWRCLGIFMLGGLQGLMGWYMVKSGLVDNPHVSHYRLAAHLLLALLILGVMFWHVLLLSGRSRVSHKLLWRYGVGFIALLIIQIALGALVAGLKAGYMYNSFPLMAGEWLPELAWQMQPWYTNLVENPVMVQFLHRINALVLVLAGVLWWKHGLRSGIGHKRWYGLLGVVMVQVMLGVLTLLYAVPVMLGVVHQVMAFLVMACALWLLYGVSNNGAPSRGI